MENPDNIACVTAAAEIFIDLSHAIEAGMTTYKGLPAPFVCDYLSREYSRTLYEPGTEFSIQSVQMVGNTGTYLDSPFHRYADGADLSALALKSLARLNGIVIHRPFQQELSTDVLHLEREDVRGKAVLIRTGWDRHWRTPVYFESHPFLTEAAARFLAGNGALLVGIDSHNIDDTRGRSRPVHTALLGAGIPICEHMTNLGALPARGFRFYAVPPRLIGVGSFPVRAFAILDG